MKLRFLVTIGSIIVLLSNTSYGNDCENFSGTWEGGSLVTQSGGNVINVDGEKFTIYQVGCEFISLGANLRGIGEKTTETIEFSWDKAKKVLSRLSSMVVRSSAISTTRIKSSAVLLKNFRKTQSDQPY